MVVAEAELARRGDHAVGDMAVGLARRDRERTGQHGAGQRHDDLVADEEVVGAADDAVHGVSAVGRGLAVGPTRTWHQRMVLPLVCGSSTNSSTWPTTIGPVELEARGRLLLRGRP